MSDLNEDTLLDMENASELSMDDIEDLPEFILPPDGLYVFALSTAKINVGKDKAGHETKRINHVYAIQKVIQLADSNELLPEVGSLVGENFTMNEKGLPIWKAKAKGILGPEKLKGCTIKEVVDILSTEGGVFVGKTRIKKTKGENGKEYENVQIQIIRNTDDKFDLEAAE